MSFCLEATRESIVEAAALEWFGELGYAVGHEPHLAPGEQAGGTLTPDLSQKEREKREAIRRLNPAFPEEARELSVALAEKVVHNPERQTV